MARGTFDLSVAKGVGAEDSVVERVFGAGWWESWEVEGPLLEQAEEIVREWAEWSYDLGRVASWYMESFALRTRNADLAPVTLWGMIAGMGVRLGVASRVVEVSPSSGKGFATDARLRNWGGWVVGSTHRRDAVRVLLYGLKAEIAKGLEMTH